MEATASDTSVLARMLSWFFRIVSLKTVPISEPHMIAIHNALFMMAGEFVSQGATTDQHGLNTALYSGTLKATSTQPLPSIRKICLPFSRKSASTRTFFVQRSGNTQSHLEGQEHQAKSKNMRPNGPSTRMLSLCS